jgi:hypothetical protein
VKALAHRARAFAFGDRLARNRRMGTSPYDAANVTALLAANLVYEFISLGALNRRTCRQQRV